MSTCDWVRFFLTIEQVWAELGVDPIGLIPDIANVTSSEHGEGDAAILRYSINNPISLFAATLRSAKVAADEALKDRSPKIIGLVSLLPNEGKSTVAKNFASLLAVQRASTLLIDADTLNPALSLAMGYEKPELLQDGHFETRPMEELLRYEPESGLQILPCVYRMDDPRRAEGLASRSASAFVAKQQSIL